MQDDHIIVTRDMAIALLTEIALDGPCSLNDAVVYLTKLAEGN